MQVFAEQFGFKIMFQSYRCPHVPQIEDICPGSTDTCEYCDSPIHCHRSGGTSFTIQFNHKSDGSDSK
jgi:hypothetical protein